MEDRTLSANALYCRGVNGCMDGRHWNRRTCNTEMDPPADRTAHWDGLAVPSGVERWILGTVILVEINLFGPARLSLGQI